MHDLIEELKVALPAVFESEDYQKQRGAVEQAIQAKGQTAFAALNEKAQAHNIAILRTPSGFTMAPLKNGKIVPPEEFNAWTREEQLAVQAAIESLEKDLEDTLRGMPRLEKEQRDAVLRWNAKPRASRWNIRSRRSRPRSPICRTCWRISTPSSKTCWKTCNCSPPRRRPRRTQGAHAARGALERFEVNVMVTQSEHGPDSPVIEELNPTLANLVGRIEYLQLQGALVTNFRLIKAGALHRANGGYLLLDARSLLMEPFSWAALKRALPAARSSSRT